MESNGVSKTGLETPIGPPYLEISWVSQDNFNNSKIPNHFFQKNPDSKIKIKNQFLKTLEKLFKFQFHQKPLLLLPKHKIAFSRKISSLLA
jgi:hypothetical protein